MPIKVILCSCCDFSLLQRSLTPPTNWTFHDNLGVYKHLVMWLSGDHSYPPCSYCIVFITSFTPPCRRTNQCGDVEWAVGTSIVTSWSPSVSWQVWHGAAGIFIMYEYLCRLPVGIRSDINPASMLKIKRPNFQFVNKNLHQLFCIFQNCFSIWCQHFTQVSLMFKLKVEKL